MQALARIAKRQRTSRPAEPPPCCCRFKSPRQEQTPLSPPAAPDHRCPCHQCHRTAVLTDRSSFGADRFDAATSLWRVIDAFSARPLLTDVGSITSRVRSLASSILPFLTAEDILRALHILRC
jgi:hypothetical protein